MKVAVTTFFTKSYKELAEITTNVLRQYCAKRNYDLYIHEVEDGNVDFIITKDTLELIKKYDLVLSIECDILITNFNKKVEDFIDDYNNFFICRDVNNINFGCFITKSSGAHVLYLILRHSHLFKTEQNVLEYYQPSHKVKYLSHPSINSIPYDFYYPSYGYMGYQDGEVREKPTHEMGNWEHGDFCCHLPGMPLEKRIQIFNKLKEEIIYG